jgi:uncharacterized protein YkwD
MTTLGVRFRRCTATLAVALVVLAGVAGMVASAPPASAAAADGGFAARMLELVNQQRAAANLAPLQLSDSLGRVAQDGRYDGCGFAVLGRATDMGARNYFSHTIAGCGTQGVSAMLAAAGVQTSGYGENIAWMNGTTDPLLAAEHLTSDLMASPAHRANILNPDFTSIGIGSWHTAAGQTWTGAGTPLMNVFLTAQVFGRMAASPPPPAAPALPEQPTAVAATGADGSIAVSWAPAGSGPAVDSYGAFAWDSAGYTNHFATACPTCRNATVTGLTNGRTYYVTVYGHDAAGWGAAGYSGWVTVAAVPAAPTEVRAVPGNGSVGATWRGPTNPGTAIDGYAMFVFDASGYTDRYAWVCSTCTTATVTGLVNGHAYYTVVYAHNPNGWGAATVSDTVVAGTPGPVANLVVSRANGSVAVSWAPASSSPAPVDSYGLFAFDANGYTGLYGTACATCTSGTVAGLTNGRAYTIVVYAHDTLGWGSPTTSSPVVPAAL